MVAERLRELAAMVLIGDGALSFVDPDRHSKLWQSGPGPWQQMMEPFVRNPELTRWLGAAAVGFGLWLGSRQNAGMSRLTSRTWGEANPAPARQAGSTRAREYAI